MKTKIKQKITPETTGCSQTACEIINETFLSLDGFEALRQQCDDSTYKSTMLAANCARIVDRILQQQSNTSDSKQQG